MAAMESAALFCSGRATKIAMSVAVQSIYDRVTYDMLENGGLVLGTVTSAQFLTYLEEAVLEFCQQAGLVRKIYTQRVIAGTAQYAAPVDVMQIQCAFVGGKYIQPTSTEELQNSEYEWSSKSGPPQSWFADGMPANQIKLFPNPDTSGTVFSGTYGTFLPANNGLTVVGPAGPTTNTLTLLGDIPEEVPDSFTPYLTYRVLYRVFSTDGEAKDLQRAYYCDARWKEGVALAQAIMNDLLEERGSK